MDDLFDFTGEKAIDDVLEYMIYDDVTADDEDGQLELLDLEEELLGLEGELLELDQDDLDLDRELETEMEGLKEDFDEEFGADEDW